MWNIQVNFIVLHVTLSFNPFHYCLPSLLVLWPYTEDDIKLNSQTFNWPAKMDPIFEVSQKRLLTKKDKSEQELKDKVAKFEELLNEYHSTIESYREKEV